MHFAETRRKTTACGVEARIPLARRGQVGAAREKRRSSGFAGDIHRAAHLLFGWADLALRRVADHEDHEVSSATSRSSDNVSQIFQNHVRSCSTAQRSTPYSSASKHNALATFVLDLARSSGIAIAETVAGCPGISNRRFPRRDDCLRTSVCSSSCFARKLL